MAAVSSRLVGVLPAGGQSQAIALAGQLDTAAHAQMLLATMALRQRTAQGPEETGSTLSAPARRSQWTRSLADDQTPSHAHRPGQPHPQVSWFPMLRRSAQLNQLVKLNRRMRANRTSGGVGGMAGKRPPSRPDRTFLGCGLQA